MHNSWLQKIGSCTVPAVCMLLSATARAEDTEIFFNTSTNAVKPNILFVFDTSGSMNANPLQDTRPKIDVIKQAMRAVIDEAPPVNIGMARFTANNGGAILYPITDIDKAAPPVISETVLAGGDDAEETSSGNVKLTEPILNFDSTVNNEWVAIRFPSVNVPNGAKIKGAALTFYPSKNGNCDTDYGNLTMRMYAEASDNASEFEATAANLSSRARTSDYVDWAIPNWGRYYDSTLNTCIGGPQSITDEDFPDLINVIKEVIDRKGWCGGNSMVLMLQHRSGSGFRRASSFEGDVSRPPALTIEFSEESGDFANTGAETPKCFTKSIFSRIASGLDDVEEDANGTVTPTNGDELSFNQILGEKTNNAAVGLRFQNINVPKNATITEAKLSVFAAEKSASNTTVSISSHVDTATGTIDGFGTAKKSVTSLSTLGTENVTFGSWEAGAEYQSSDIKSIIQSVVKTSNWGLGKAFALIIKPVSGANKHIWQQERGIATSAKIKITYKGSYEKGAFTVRDQLKAATNGFKALGGTPVADALMEAARYYRGETVSDLAGRRGTTALNRENNVSHPSTITAATLSHSVPSGCNLALDPYGTACKDEKVSGTYQSPITDSCQSNHIVLLTDGEPNGLHTSTNAWVAAANHVGSACKTNDGGIDCSLKTVSWLNSADQVSTMLGEQTINTHAVSFDLKAGSKAAVFMDNIAKAGGGEKAYVANNTQEIIEAFTTIINNIDKRSATFVSSGVTVSQANRLIHEDALYFSMFQPGPSKRWEGNLKRYRLDNDGVLVDVNGTAAVNPLSDQFVDKGIRSWWSTKDDGNTVRLGGAADQLTASRTVYTNINGNSEVALSDGTNNLHETNTSITWEKLGLSDSTNRTKLLQWARGLDVDDLDGDNSTTDAHNLFGDPLHSRPGLVRYKVGTGYTMRAFVGTNFGYLHSIDVASSANPDGTGQEKWAFLPAELLKNLHVLYANESLSPGTYHGPYGLDSSIRVHVIDNNSDGLVDAGAGDKAYLYVGMRRGGQSYYALDVSSPDTPVLQYVINETIDPDYAGMGQTWGVPVVAKIKTGASTTARVLIFGGGYDLDQDVDDVPISDADISEGKMVFITDADTGKLLWSSKDSGLSMNSVAADVAVLDTTGDGVVDHIYAVDMRAQVFRFDISNNGTVKGYLLASLQPDVASKADNRRFYAKVDPAFVRRPSGEEFVALSIGSGYRAHPLEAGIENHFYMLRDTWVLQNEAPDTIKLGDLVDITSMLTFLPDGRSAALAEIEDNDKAGWYLDFDAKGEKVLAESVTFDNVVYFTTYLPPSAAVSGCAANAGSARLYSVGLLDGMPVKDQNGDTKVDSGEDRYQELADRPSAGLINPQFLSTPTGFKLCVGNDCDDVSAPATLRRVKWQHLTNQ